MNCRSQVLWLFSIKIYEKMVLKFLKKQDQFARHKEFMHIKSKEAKAIESASYGSKSSLKSLSFILQFMKNKTFDLMFVLRLL